MNSRLYIFNAVFGEYVFPPVVRAYEFVLLKFAQIRGQQFFQ
jgi:ABC-type transporter lipoprotein component MlaA